MGHPRGLAMEVLVPENHRVVFFGVGLSSRGFLGNRRVNFVVGDIPSGCELVLGSELIVIYLPGRTILLAISRKNEG